MEMFLPDLAELLKRHTLENIDETPLKKRNKTQTQNTDLEDILQIARSMWHRDPTKVRSTLTEDRDFREFFGCGAQIAIMLWKNAG